eukprot:TRINITY_DN24445_c0_g1_i1.p1 TRINITY_DN24445_c0_g1~~TRINITY_DN24445_c0_g1_i1.p1  ORF type:complete len:681 (-),score=86.45 TRINITY_DN24445_c0_g1_i1:510-2552(-)
MEFSYRNGFISRGGDLHKETMTVEEAKQKCEELPGCKGFCHRGAVTSDPVEILFKDKWDNTVGSNIWTSYKITASRLESQTRADPEQLADAVARDQAAAQGDQSIVAQNQTSPHTASSSTAVTKRTGAQAISHAIKLLSTLECNLDCILEVVKGKASSVSFFCREYWGSSASTAQVALVDLPWSDPLGRNVRQACILESLSLAVMSQMSSGSMNKVAVGVRLKLRKLVYHVYENCLVSLDLLRKRLKSEKGIGADPDYFDFSILAREDRYRELSEGEHAMSYKKNNEAILSILPPLCSGATSGGKADSLVCVVSELLKDVFILERKGPTYVRREMLSRLYFKPFVEGQTGGSHAPDPFERFGRDRFAQNGTVVQFEPLPPMFADLDRIDLLPFAGSSSIYTLVLDLDETLIHSFDDESGFEMRPGLIDFLHRMSALSYEIVIYTSALQDYADRIINQVDPNGLIKYRLYRQHGQPWGPLYIKDLSRLGRDLSRTIIIDDISDNFCFQPDNGVAISPWKADNSQDRALYNLVPVLEELICTCARVPDILGKYKQQIPLWVGPNSHRNVNNISMPQSYAQPQQQFQQTAPIMMSQGYPQVATMAPMPSTGPGQFAPMMMMEAPPWGGAMQQWPAGVTGVTGPTGPTTAMTQVPAVAQQMVPMMVPVMMMVPGGNSTPNYAQS